MSTAAWDVGNLQIVLWDEEAVQYKAEDVALPLPAPPPPGYGPDAEARKAER